MSLDLRHFDRSAWVADPAALRACFRAHSFLYLRGLLPRDEVLQVRSAVLRRLSEVGWLAPGTEPYEALPGPVAHHDRGQLDGRRVADPKWSVGYRKVQSLESLHALAHHPQLTRVLRALLGDNLVVHPRKIARIGYPGIQFPTPPHQDALFNKTATDVLTAWIPLGDCAREHGGLRVLDGSAHLGVLPVLPADGLGGERVDVPEDDPDWVEGDYQAGDVILFHSFTVHMAPPNRTERIRLSMDCRFQSASEPVKPASLLPHGFGAGVLPSWTELTKDWERTGWVEVPLPVRVATVPPLVPVPSALLGSLAAEAGR